jgi:hypothetical protein
VLTAQPLGPGATVAVDVSDGYGAQLPVNTRAVAVNVTVSGITQQTFVSLCPGGTPAAACKGTSTLNPYAGRDVANLTVATLGPSAGGGNPDGLVVYNDRGNVLVSLDVVGFYMDDDGGSGGGTDYAPAAAPYRTGSVTLGQEEIQTLTIGNVPASASAAVVRVTAAAVTANTYVSACPVSTAKPVCIGSSTLNSAGRDVGNVTIVPLGPARTINLYNNRGSATVLVDVLGFQVPPGQGLRYLPLDPFRYLTKEPLGPAQAIDFVSTDRVNAKAVAANLTTSGNTATTYLSSCPTSVALADCITTSSVNSYPGQDTASGAFITTGQSGTITFTLYNNRGTTLVDMDLLGLFVDTRTTP